MRGLKKLANAFRVKHEEVYSKGVKLQVLENNDVRMFKLDGATNSIINKKSIYTGGYWDYFIPVAYAYRNPKILMIGLGIGTTPYQLHSLFGKGLRIDIAELDRKVVELAKKCMPAISNDRIFVADGYDYVSRTRNRYDLIILDAYGRGANMPRQFFSSEFVENACRILGGNGTMAINYAMHPSGILHFQGYKKLLKRFFHVYSVKTTSLGDTQVIVCSKGVGKEALLSGMRARMPRNRNNSLLLRAYSRMRDL